LNFISLDSFPKPTSFGFNFFFFVAAFLATGSGPNKFQNSLTGSAALAGAAGVGAGSEDYITDC
jgi:hypothetical protein